MVLHANPAPDAVNVPLDILPAVQVNQVPAFEFSTWNAPEFSLSDGQGSPVPGELEVLPTRVVFHPDEPLHVGEYTLTAAEPLTPEGEHTIRFSTGDTLADPPGPAPTLADGVVTQWVHNLPSCFFLGSFGGPRYQELSGSLEPATEPEDGVFSWVRVHRVDDPGDEVDEPGVWLPAGSSGGLMRWLAADRYGPDACFRFQTESAAGAVSELGEGVCVPVEGACGCGAPRGGLGWAWPLVVVLLRRRRPGA